MSNAPKSIVYRVTNVIVKLSSLALLQMAEKSLKLNVKRQVAFSDYPPFIALQVLHNLHFFKNYNKILYYDFIIKHFQLETL